MAIRKQTNSDLLPLGEDEVSFVFNNGDLTAVEDIMSKWKFKDEESLLRFALAVLVKASDGSVSIKEKSGASVTVRPAEYLLAKE